MKRYALLLLLLVFVCGVGDADDGSCRMDAAECAGNSPEGRCICVAFFYSPTCGHCHNVDAFLEGVRGKYPGLVINKYNAQDEKNSEYKEAFDILYNVPDEMRAYVPAVYLGEKYYIGDGDLSSMEAEIGRYVESGLPCPCANLSLARNQSRDSIIGRFNSFSVLTVVFAGLVDSVNPCAFAGIIFFLSYLSATGRKGRDVLLIGGLYSLGVFSAYMLLGLGAIRFVSYAEEASLISKFIYPATGLIAIVFSAYSFSDYLKARDGRAKEMTLQLPDRLKGSVRKTIREAMRFRHLALAAFGVGFLISMFEFLCTGQVYLPTIVYIMGVPELRGQASLYLTLYNILFISPLALIFISAYYGTSSTKLQAVLTKRLAAIKLATAVFFLIVGLYLIQSGARLFGVI